MPGFLSGLNGHSLLAAFGDLRESLHERPDHGRHYRSPSPAPGSAPTPPLPSGKTTATSVTVVNSTTLQAVTPSGLPIAVDVKVITRMAPATLDNGFHVYDAAAGPGSCVRVQRRKRHHGGRSVPATAITALSTAPPGARAGKFGKALSFNGTTSWVTVNDSPSLHLSTGMTIEAWVNPATTGGWRNVLIKEQTGAMVYALYSNTDTNQPSGHVTLASEVNVRGTSAVPANTWTHLAATYNGVILRIYVNGVEVANKQVSGNISQRQRSAAHRRRQHLGRVLQRADRRSPDLQPAVFGGRNPERHGCRALGDTTPPTVSMTAPANGATVTGSVTVSANASDNVGVAGVQFLLDGAPLGTEDHHVSLLHHLEQRRDGQRHPYAVGPGA